MVFATRFCEACFMRKSTFRAALLIAASTAIVACGADTNTVMGARAATKELVLEQLKAPRTAKFSDVSATLVEPGVYLVGGDVDAENSYGALVRNSISGRLTWNAKDRRFEGDIWLNGR